MDPEGMRVCDARECTFRIAGESNELGFIRLPHDWEADPFPGTCPYHGDCLEGLASGPAIEGRWGKRAETLPTDHPAWELEAAYLAQALRTLSYVTAPEKILLGGGVMQQPGLLELVQSKLGEQFAGYVTSDALRRPLDGYVVAPAFGQDAGLFGAIALAMEAAI
jgi:fructokinase